MNDNLIVFAKVKNASITINEEAYPIRLHKLRACFIPYVCIDGYCRAVIIRIFRGEMFAALGELEYSNIKNSIIPPKVNILNLSPYLNTLPKILRIVR